MQEPTYPPKSRHFLLSIGTNFYVIFHKVYGVHSQQANFNGEVTSNFRNKTRFHNIGFYKQIKEILASGKVAILMLNYAFAGLNSSTHSDPQHATLLNGELCVNVAFRGGERPPVPNAYEAG
jgi:hypothetical protein